MQEKDCPSIKEASKLAKQLGLILRKQRCFQRGVFARVFSIWEPNPMVMERRLVAMAWESEKLQKILFRDNNIQLVQNNIPQVLLIECLEDIAAKRNMARNKDKDDLLFDMAPTRTNI